MTNHERGFANECPTVCQPGAFHHERSTAHGRAFHPRRARDRR
jgi:hypothetical protein